MPPSRVYRLSRNSSYGSFLLTEWLIGGRIFILDTIAKHSVKDKDPTPSLTPSFAFFRQNTPDYSPLCSITQLRDQVGKEVEVDMRPEGLGRFSGTLERIAPKASRELPHSALSAMYDGPLDVRKEETTHLPTDMEQSSQYLLFSPRFSFDVAAHSELLQKLREGQRVSIHVPGGRRTLAMVIRKRVTDWLKEKKRLMQ